jgi:serine/threonine protein phosphatase PrpC
MMRITWENLKDVVSKNNQSSHPNKQSNLMVPDILSSTVNTHKTNTTMNSDSAFVIGSTHDVCQDYVAHKSNGSKSHVVLADGCSGSPDSDVGARLLVKTHELFIPTVGVMDFNEYANKASSINLETICRASKVAKNLQLDSMALDATLMSIISNKSGEFMVTCYGDGVVVLGRKDGIIETYSVSYNEGYPNYLSYLLSKERKDKFNEKVNNYKEITLEMIGQNNEENLKQKYKSSVVFDIYLGSMKNYSWVAVVSDGIHSFTEKQVTSTSVCQEPVPLCDVVKELFAFKNYQGCFVKRRLKRFLDVCKSKNWSNGDDLSIGVVYLGGSQ